MQERGVGENSIRKKQGSLSRPPRGRSHTGFSALSGTETRCGKKGRAPVLDTARGDPDTGALERRGLMGTTWKEFLHPGPR